MTFSYARRHAVATAAMASCCILALPAVNAATETGAMVAEAGARPRVGLVLAGGGAKGGAHVGVLKVLEELHVPVDCIAGTSMGAVIGGGYASGMPAADIEKFVAAIDWKSVVGGVGQRQFEPFEQKRYDSASGSVVKVGVADGRIVGPAGLVDTSSIETLLRSYVATARSVPDFNRLPIPYRAVATDMVTGKMVVLDHGDLATAMRASMAIPGAFAPVALQDAILSDGGMVRNIPVDVARNLCADVVVVVNLVTPPVKREKLVTAAQLALRSMDVMLQSNEDLQLATLTPRDVRIDVPMGDITAADFERTSEAIPLGEAAARAVADKLRAYALSEPEYLAWRRHVNTRQAIDTRLADVQFEGLKRINPDYLRTIVRVKPGERVDTDSISDDALRMSVLEDVDAVGYRLVGDPDHPTLVWLPKEAAAANAYLRPSAGIYAAGKGDLDFIVGLQYVRRWLNSYGGQWRNSLQAGNETLLSTSVYQPLNVRQSVFIEPKLYLRRSFEDVYDDGHRVAGYMFVDFGALFDVGVNLGRGGQLRAGYWIDKRRSDVNTGATLLPQFNLRDGGVHADALYDSRNAAAFASYGIAAEVEYLQADTSLGGDRDWRRIEAAVRKPIGFGRSLIWFTAAGGADLGDDLPADYAFSLGGPESFPGYAHDEIRARSYWTAGTNVLWKVKDILSVRNSALYAGFGLQAGQVFDRVDPVPDGDIYGFSATLGGRTPIGVLTLGVGFTQDSWAGWVSIGRPVGRGTLLDEGLFR